MRNWWCGRGLWWILVLVFGILLFYQIVLSLFILTRFNIFLIFLFLIMCFFSFFRILW